MTLFWYIFGRVARIFLIIFVTVLLLIAMVDMIELLRKGGGQEGLFGPMLAMAFLHAPSVSMKAVPFVMLLSGMWAYMQLVRSSELVASSAAGMSFWRLARPGVIAAAMIGVIGITVYAPLSSAALTVYERLDGKYFKGRGPLFSLSSEGLWLREGNQEGQTVIHAARTNAEGTELHSATFYHFDQNDALQRRVDTSRALLSDGKWELTEVKIQTVDLRSPQPPVEEEVEYLEIETRLTPAEIQNSFASPDSISFWSLPGVIRAMEAAGFSARRHKAQFHSMLALPALMAAMVLIAAAFSIRPPRMASFGSIALGCTLTGFAFYFMSDVSLALGASGSAPVILAAWGPAIGAAFLGLAFSLHFREI